MAAVNEFFNGPTGMRRVGLVIGLLVLVGLGIGVYTSSYQSKYVPLYSDLTEEDAAKVLQRLDEMKVEYQFSEAGSDIMVATNKVDETRIKLDGSNLSIHGGEGFELFDNADYGMTEFVQKINYQRALQGELARTIIGLKEVRYARVHLVLPEQGLFRQSKVPPKASVTLVQKPNMYLSSAQISGIQHLVASAVQSMDASSVTVLDDRGVVLTEASNGDNAVNQANLGSKQQIEQYLALKASMILEQIYGAGLAVVKVDVSLGRNQLQVTNESWSSPETTGQGMVANSKTQKKFRDAETNTEGSAKNALLSEVTEVDYLVDKRIEQLVQGEGQIERMTVSVLVPMGSSDSELKALQELIANAVGLQTARGDAIGVFAMPANLNTGVAEAVFEHDEGQKAAQRAQTALLHSGGDAVANAAGGWSSLSSLALLGLFLLALGLAIAYFFRTRANAVTLSDSERNALLAEIKQWLEEAGPPAPQADTAVVN